VRPAVLARSAADCSSSSLVHAITAVPEPPLVEASTYVVAVTAGLTASGEPLVPSPTWALVREADNPVTIRDGAVVLHRTPFDPADDATAIVALDALWRFYRPAMGFLTGPAGLARDDVLLAWTFTTQTLALPFNPSEAGSPASIVPGAPLTELATLLVDPVSGAPVPVSDVLEDALGLDPGACALLGCEAVGDILRGRLAAPRYTTETPNPRGTGPGPAGAWDDPLRPSAQRLDSLRVTVVLPGKTLPAAGCPTVVFSHDAGRSRSCALSPTKERRVSAMIVEPEARQGSSGPVVEHLTDGLGPRLRTQREGAFAGRSHIGDRGGRGARGATSLHPRRPPVVCVPDQARVRPGCRGVWPMRRPDDDRLRDRQGRDRAALAKHRLPQCPRWRRGVCRVDASVVGLPLADRERRPRSPWTGAPAGTEEPKNRAGFTHPGQPANARAS
jgi:hypothetical protein